MKLPLWGGQNQATYFLKERTFWNRWRSNMGIPIHMLFFIQKYPSKNTYPIFFYFSFSRYHFFLKKKKFRNFDFFLKKSYDVHFIFKYIFRIFFVFCSRCKIATVSGPAEEAVKKKRIGCEKFCAAILFSKNLLQFISRTLTLVEICMQNQISKISIHFSLIKSIKWPFISCS